MSTSRPDTAFLFDGDSTLLDNDRAIAALRTHIEHEVGAARTSTCRRHDINPQAYLTQLVANLPDTPIGDLDPWL